MQFERLKKSHKKEIIIALIAVCVIGGALTFSLTRAKYKIANDLELAKGTINYKAYDFKIMAMYKSDDKENYTEIEEMPSEGYIINESKSYCNMSNGNKDTTAILKTIDGNHSISKLKKNDRCYLYFDRDEATNKLKELGLTANTTTPDFSQIATTDEGIFATEDGMYGGTSYYWRGAVTNNYVKFANFCWRAIRINGDGSIRLIYDGRACHQNGESTTDSIAVSNVQYNTNSNRSEYVGWTYVNGKQRPETEDIAIDSNAKIKIDEWYNNNIGNKTTFASSITHGKYCNNRDVDDNLWNSVGSAQNYNLLKKFYSEEEPSLNCKNDMYEIKIGLISLDEVIFAGEINTANKSFYLYNGQNYWTMSPGLWNSSHGFIFAFSSDGYFNTVYVANSTFGLRPVINLRSDVTFSGGDGTLNNPYIVS